MACVFFLSAAVAFMQGRSRPLLGRPDNPQPQNAAPVEAPRTHLNQNRLHKLIIEKKDIPVYNQLANAKAIRQEVDYGSFKLVVVDEEALGGRAALQAMPVAPRDDQNMIALNGYLIDTSNLQPLSEELPADLKQSRMSAAMAGGFAPGKGLYLVQFIGPIKDEWLKALEGTGTKTIAYIPNNAYVVHADDRAAGELAKLKNQSSFVQWLGDYEPAYKLRPELRAARQSSDPKPIKVTVQIIDSAEGALKADQLKPFSLRSAGERRVLKYRNITIQIPASQLTELAKSDEVFAIEEYSEPVRLDEVQGQIVAGNLSGNAPSGPGYLAWLAGQGFDSSQFTSFAVNVVDDAYSLRGHPDLPDSRIAFENNPTNQSGSQGGHGFLNAHIVGGYNDGSGPAHEDADGFNYGLGIAPWARVGLTGIFGPGAASPTVWEETAYGQSARISTNSWGIVDANTRQPILRYETLAQEFDAIVRDAQRGVAGNQQLTVVFAASNSGPGSGTVGAPGTAKNILTVGASENVRPSDGCRAPGSIADSANDIAFFSSRGPVNPGGGDGRAKPDIVAPGTHIIAGVPQSNYNGSSVECPNYPSGQTLYGLSSGTSLATPAVAGGAALVYQDFLNKGLGAPSPAMVKATLMNSTSYLTGAGANDTLPSNSQGMGLMSLGRALDGTPRLLDDQTRTLAASGETFRVNGVIASNDQPFRVSLAWTDVPGATTGGPWVNNLDLEVTVNGQTYLGNVFSGPNSITGGAADGKNNVESVFLPPGLSGEFTVTVRAANIAGDGVPGNDDTTDQDFALVIYNYSAPPNTPWIGLQPSSLNFAAAVGGVNPAHQTINISNVGTGTLDWTASENTPWLTVSPASGSAPGTLTVAVDVSGLSIGAYTGTITISSAQAANSPVTASVALTVLPVFAVNPSSLNFTAIVGAANPQSQPINISNQDSVPRDWTATADASWLRITPAGGTAPSPLTVGVDTRGLSAGTYSGSIKIIPTNVPNSPITVPVALTVLPSFGVNPSSLTFSAVVGGEDPPSETIDISSSDQGPRNWVARDNARWLTLSPANGSTPSRLKVSVDTRGLPIGTYQAAIILTPVDVSASPVKVPVTLIIDRFVNGGFEELIEPWVLSGAARRSTGSHPHSGRGYLMLGGGDSSQGFAYQEVELSHRSSPKLTLWLNVESSETASELKDHLFVEVRDTRGKLLKTLATFSNLDQSTPGSYTLRGAYSLAAFKGRTVRIQFRTKTDSSAITNFRIDDVWLK